MMCERWLNICNLLFIYFRHTLNPSPSAARVRGLKGINPSLFGTCLAFWSRGLGQRLHTASTLDKHSADYFVYSRSHAFHNGNQTTKKNPTHLESNSRLSHPKGNSVTPAPPGRGGSGKLREREQCHGRGTPFFCSEALCRSFLMKNIWALIYSLRQVLAQNVHPYRGITRDALSQR